eukprot:TRINITY_DN14121_c0_g1_i1.p1 TRINITY_DN14121_c0_g1~~TRINITY_DN14121_c0_g1_i1.p1  ORF type:complete len:106 (+),score=9.13 TRINITY_DN14121_c0_g1_i1:42-320(+)
MCIRDRGEGRMLVPHHYCLRHGTTVKDVLRDLWFLQGSINGHQWDTLRRHENDDSLALEPSSVASWAVEVTGRWYRHFRILQPGCTLSLIHI